MCTHSETFEPKITKTPVLKINWVAYLVTKPLSIPQKAVQQMISKRKPSTNWKLSNIIKFGIALRETI